MNEIQIPPRMERAQKNELIKKWQAYAAKLTALELFQETLLLRHRGEIVEQVIDRASQDLGSYWDELENTQQT